MVTENSDKRMMQCMEIWGGNQPIENAASTPGLDVWVFSEPHAGASGGGDIHYLSLCGSGRIARFALADVAGHGAAVEELAGRLRTLMQRNINTLKQTRMASALNEEFGRLAEGGSFATAILATYFAPTDELAISNAGHPRPLWRRAATGEWSLLHRDCEEAQRDKDEAEVIRNLPLGVLDNTGYQQFSTPLERGDLILFYTDAAIEAAGPDGRQIGEEGLLELMRSLDGERPDTLLTSLVERLEEVRGEERPEDDLTLMLLHHNASNPPLPSLSQVARVTARMLGLQKV